MNVCNVIAAFVFLILWYTLVVLTTWVMFLAYLFVVCSSECFWNFLELARNLMSLTFIEELVFDNLTTGQLDLLKRRHDNRPCHFAVDNMENLIENQINSSENDEQSKEIKIAQMIKEKDRPILNGVTNTSDTNNYPGKVTDLRLETVKNKTTWQQMSPRRERKLGRQNSSSSGSSGSGASASGGSNSNSVGSNSIGSNGSLSPTASPTKSWKTIKESNKNNILSWKDLSPTKIAQNKNEKVDSETSEVNAVEDNARQLSPTKKCPSSKENQLDNKVQCSPEHVHCRAAGNVTGTQSDKIQRSPEHKCKITSNQLNGKVNQNEINKQSTSPEHCAGKHKDLCRNASGATDDNDYFYDEDFTVQFDTNLRESSPGLNCTCVDPSMVVDFPHMITGSYLSFNDMKGSCVLEPTNSQELFCPDESELSSCRNSAMDMSSSEREMMCSSDMLDFSDNPIFTPSPTRDLNGQNVSTDSLDRKIAHGHAPGCQNSMELSTSRTSSDGNLCVNCCPRKEEYFLSFDGSQGRSGSNSDNDNSLTSMGSGQGHWVQNSSGEGIAEECSDSFHFCYMMNGNQNVPLPSHKKKRFHSLKAVQENSLEEGDFTEDDSSEISPSRGLESKTSSLPHRTSSQVNNGSSPPRTNSSRSSSLRSRKPSKNVTSWKQVKSLKKLGKREPDFDPTRSNSMPELYYEAWHSFSSQDCRDLAKIAESFHGKRHSAYLVDLYQRVRNQSNPVSPDTMSNIEQILFHPLIGRCQGEQNLTVQESKCCGVCGHKRDDSHSSHTLTNSNVQQLMNSNRNGQQMDYYTQKRILEWLERDKMEGHNRSKSCQTRKDMKTAETIISPTTVTLWCGTKNFGSQFPPCTKDCGIQAEVDETKDNFASVEQQTSATLSEMNKAKLNDCGQQTSPIIDKDEILSLLPETFKELDEIMPKRATEKCLKKGRQIPRSKSADPNLMQNYPDKSMGSLSYYSYKSLPELNFLSQRPELDHNEHLSIFDPLPVQMPIPVFIPTADLSKSKESIVEKIQQVSGHKPRQSTEVHNGKSYKRSKSAPGKLSNPNLLKHIGESGSSSSGFSTSSTSSGIDPGYSSESRACQNGSPSNDIERLLFFPPHIVVSGKDKPNEETKAKIPQIATQVSQQHAKLSRLSERKVSKYANESHPSTIDMRLKLKVSPKSSETTQATNSKSASDTNLHLEHLDALQEENTPASSPDQQCHHKCCNGSDCFYAFDRPTYSIELGENYFEGYENEHLVLRRKFDYHCQVSSESGSSTSSGCVPKMNKKPLKSCLRKKHILRSRSLSDQFNLAQQAELQKQKRKLNRHSYACEEVYLLTDESGQYYLCHSDNMSQGEESEPEPTVFTTENIEGKVTDQQPVKMRRKRSQENNGTTDGEKDNLSGKRKSVSFASEVSFHAISPQMSPKNHGNLNDCSSVDPEVDVESIEEDCTVSTEENHSDESDVPPQEFKLSPTQVEQVYDERFVQLEGKKAMLTEVCQAAELLVNHFNTAKNPFDKLRLGSSADCEEIGDLVINKLCPALSQVVGDGLKPHLTGFQMFGRVQVNVWKVAELSAEQGPYTRAIHDLVQQLKSNPSLLSSNTKFEAFLFGLLNLRLLDYWMGYLRYNCGLTEKFYNVDGVIVLGKSCHERAYDEMLIALQPLAVLPFQLSIEYVIQHSTFQHRSPSSSPIKNKPSPGVSPTVEKVAGFEGVPNIGDNLPHGVPPPKPARLEKPANGLISTKAWEWLKGGTTNKAQEDVVRNEEKQIVENELFINEEKLNSKSINNDTKMETKPKCSEADRAPVSMTESFSGIAQKLLGISSSREKLNVDSDKAVSTAKVAQMEDDLSVENSKQLNRQTSLETVSNKAKSGLIKLFDKLLLSKETSQPTAEATENKKSSSWNFGFSQNRSPVSKIPTSKSLSPVNSCHSGNQQSTPESKGKYPVKPRLENVVAKSIQKEAKRSSKAPEVKKQQAVINSLLSKEKLQTKREEDNTPNSPSKTITKQAKPSTKSAIPAPVESPDHSQTGQKKVDKSKLSKIPTLRGSPSISSVKRREKSGAGSKIPKRYSLVLDSSGSELGSPNSSALNSPVKVRHSKSADTMSGIPTSSVSSPTKKFRTIKEKLSSASEQKPPVFKTMETAEIRNSIELVKLGQKSDKGCDNKTIEMCKMENKLAAGEKISNECSGSTSSNEQCASLELGPTLVVPPFIRDSLEKGDFTTNFSMPNTEAADISKPVQSVSKPKPCPSDTKSDRDVELDINSNSPLSVTTGKNAQVEEGKQSSALRDEQECGAKQKDSGDFSKPNFRYIQTLQSFESSEPSQLSYRKGEHYEVLAQIDSSWFYCVNGGREGLIHTEAVKPLTDREEFDILHDSFYS